MEWGGVVRRQADEALEPGCFKRSLRHQPPSPRCASQVEYWNDLDAKLESPLEVLDDVEGEAAEVRGRCLCSEWERVGRVLRALWLGAVLCW